MSLTRLDINLFTCGIAFVALLLSLKLNPVKKLTFREFAQTFDFLGMYVIYPTLLCFSSLILLGHHVSC